MAVLMSARANAFYLQQARVCVDGQRVVYISKGSGDVDLIFNIPDKNTAFVLLGKGTSITDAAARMLAESGVLIGFCGTGGSPLFSMSPMVFVEPVSEYRPTEFMQKWYGMWADDCRRLETAKQFLNIRIEWAASAWAAYGIELPQALRDRFIERINSAPDTMNLLTAEAEWAKGIYATLAKKFKISDFIREDGANKRETKSDVINGLIDHGNYIAYGYSAVVLTTLGISYAFPVLHGKTRRGALVFDVADLFKDAIIMPMAFSYGSSDPKDFRSDLIEKCFDMKLTDTLFDTIKGICQQKAV